MNLKLEKCYNITMKEAIIYLNNKFGHKCTYECGSHINSKYRWDILRIKKDIKANKINFKIIDNEYMFDLDDLDEYSADLFKEYKENEKSENSALLFIIVIMLFMMIGLMIYLNYTDSSIMKHIMYP